MSRLKVFLSSTYADMRDERAALERVLHRLASTTFVGMEYFGARDDTPQTASLDEVDRSDLYVGIIGHRFGSGITAQEYERACGRGIPCMLYLKAGEPPLGVEATHLRDRLLALRETMRLRHVVGEFDAPDRLASQVVADLHNLMLRREPARAHAALREAHDRAIERFVAEYRTGATASEPAVFGGRDSELAELDAWANDEAGEPFGLLAGPAGRGKSALLVHWVTRLRDRQGLDVIFFPISGRFGTNLALAAYVSITSRLAELHGEVVPASLDTPEQAWRSLLAVYLGRALPNGRNALLVIDGADEARDWELASDLFALEPPRGLRVLVSARYLAGDIDSGGWLERLGWTTPGHALAINLRPLTYRGVEAVLQTLSVPLERLSRRQEIVQELLRLSEGDPLLVKLYVVDLWERGDQVARLQVQDLVGIRPGLDGYFARWWKDQNALWGEQSPLLRPAVEQIFQLLAFAFEPLSLDELRELRSGLPTGGALDLVDLIQPLRRLVIGDGLQQGYVFAHPRLGEYFYQRLVASGGAVQHDGAFIEWGWRCLEQVRRGDLPPERLPPYLLRCLREHLKRAGRPPEEFLALATPEWVRAWERVDRGSHVGLANELAQLQLIAAEAGAKATRQGLSCALASTDLRVCLYQASISTLAGDVPVEMLVALVRRDVWSVSQAVMYACRSPYLPGRLQMLLVLAARLDADQRPVVMASAVQAWRDLREKLFDESVESVLDVVTAPPLLPVSGREAANTFDCVSRLAAQLPEAERVGVLTDLIRRAKQWPDECAVMSLRAIAVWAEPAMAASIETATAATVRGWIARPASLPDLMWARERLTLLRDFLSAEFEPLGDDTTLGASISGGAALQSLRCVLRLALSSVALAPETRMESLERALACVCCTPRDAPHVANLLAPWLDAAQRARLLEAVRGLAPEALAQVHLALLQSPCEGAEVAGHEKALVALLTDGRIAVKDSWDWLLRHVDALGAPAAHDIVSRLVRRTRPREALLALDGLLCRPYPPGLAARLADDLINAVEWRALAPGDRMAVLRALSVTLRPAGTAWRADEIAPDDASDMLFFAIQRLLRRVRLDSARGQALQRSLAATEPTDVTATTDLCDADTDVARAVCRDWRLTVEAVPRKERSTPAENDPDLLMASELKMRQVGSSPLGWINLARSVARQGDAAVVRRAVALLLESEDSLAALDDETLLALPSRVCSDALHPPEPATLTALQRVVAELLRRAPDAGALMVRWQRVPLTDAARATLLLAILEATDDDIPGQVEARRRIIADCVRLPRLDPDLLLKSMAVASVDGLPAQQVRRLGRHLNSKRLMRWLSRDDVLPGLAAQAIVDESRQRYFGGSRRWWDVVMRALAGMAVDRRLAWLDQLMPLLDVDVASHVADMLSDLEPSPDRLRLQSRLLDFLAPDKRRVVLAQSFKHAAGAHADVIDRLFERLAIEIEAAPDLLDAALQCALAIADPVFRQRTIALLCRRLDVQRVSNLVLALRRIDDRADVLRALASLARQTGPRTPARAALVERLTAVSVELARSRTLSGDELSAVLASVDKLQANARWACLRDALAAPVTLSSTHEATAYRGLAAACVDAPSDVWMAFARWIGRQPDTSARVRCLTDLACEMPWAARLLAVSRFEPRDIGSDMADFLDDVARQRLRMRAQRLRRRFGAGWSTWVLARQRADRTPYFTEPLLCRARPGEFTRTLRDLGSDRRRQLAIEAWAVSPQAQRRHLSFAVAAAALLPAGPMRDQVARALAAWSDDFELGWERARLVASPADRALALSRLSQGRDDGERARCRREIESALAAERNDAARAFAGAACARRDPILLTTALRCMWSGHNAGASEAGWLYLVAALADAERAEAIRSLEIRCAAPRRAWLLARSAAHGLGPHASVAALDVVAHLPSAALRSLALSALLPVIDEARREHCMAAVDTLSVVDFAWIEGLGALTHRWPSCWTASLARRAGETVGCLVDQERIGDWLRRALRTWPAASWTVWFDALRRLVAPALRAGLIVDALATRDDLDLQICYEHALELPDVCDLALVIWRIGSLAGDDGLREQALVDLGREESPVRRIATLASMGVVDGSVFEALDDAFRREAIRYPSHVEAARRQVDGSGGAGAMHATFLTAPAIVPRRAGVHVEVGRAVEVAVSSEVSPPNPPVLQRLLIGTSPPTRQTVLEPATGRLFTSIRTAPYGSFLQTPVAVRADSVSHLDASFDRARWMLKRVGTATDSEILELIEATPPLVDPLRAAVVLRALAPTLDEGARARALAVALRLADRTARRRAFSALLSKASSARSPNIAPLVFASWQTWLDRSRNLRRPELLQTFEDVVPLLHALGGDDALIEAGDALVEASTLWP